MRWLLVILLISSSAQAQRFAVLGDYGLAGTGLQQVSDMVKGWNPDFIITAGDNNYNTGDSTTIDPNIGQYFHRFIDPYYGTYGPGADTNRFYPSLGNHDWVTLQGQPYLDYFTLPGNERYYDFKWGHSHFFALNSNPAEPDGTSPPSVQGQWLENKLTNCTCQWKLVYFHHAPYSSSSNHGSTVFMQWPFGLWGATVVLAGHDHTYERIHTEGITYFVNGLGGKSKYNMGPPVEGSAVRYNDEFGAMLCEAFKDSLVFEFRALGDTLIDRYTIIDTLNLSTELVTVYPNPFTDNTIIKFTLEKTSQVKLGIYDAQGRLVETLKDEVLGADVYHIRWEPTVVTNGTFYCRLVVDDQLMHSTLISIR